MIQHPDRAALMPLLSACVAVLAATVTGAQAIDTFPFYAGFESSDDGFVAGGNNPSWERGVPQAVFVERAAHGSEAWATALAGDHFPHEDSWLESPVFDFTGFTSDPWLSFSNAFRLHWTSKYHVELSLDGGSFQFLSGHSSATGWFVGSTGWSRAIVGTNSLAGPYATSRRKLVGAAGRTAQLRWALDASTSSTDGVGLDDVMVFETLTDLTPRQLSFPVSGHSLGASQTLYANITNLGTEPVTGFSVTFEVDGPIVSTVVGNYTTTIQPFQDVSVSSPQGVDLSALGEYTITLSMNTPGDQITENNIQVTQVVHQPLIDEFPFFASFETNNDGFVASGSWERGVPQSPLIASATHGTHAFVTSLAGSPTPSEIARLTLPGLDLSDMVEDPVLRFQAMGTPGLGQRKVEMSLDGGAFEEVGGYNTPGSVGIYDAPADGVWRPAEQVLLGAAGHIAVVRIILERGYSASSSEGFAVDAVSVTSPGWGSGQRPRNSVAVLDVNSAVEVVGFPPEYEKPGPYYSVVEVGSDTFDLSVEGAPLQPVTLYGGLLAPALLDLGSIGKVDIASNHLVASGLSGDGFGPFFFTGPDGTMSLSVSVPTSLAGTIVTYQALVGSPTFPVRLSNAVQVVFLP